MAADKKKVIALMKTDLYGLFELASDATEKEIKSAYRKKALKCHPDKNPDNPKAADLFQQLTDALEILTDPIARGTYDKLLKAKENAALRDRDLDAKRRKLKEDLEARERGADERKLSAADLAKQLQQEIERLRKEGSRILEEESRLMREQLAKTMSGRGGDEAVDQVDCTRIKIRWSPALGAYRREDLERFLKRHGRIAVLVVSNKKPGSAMVEFEEVKSAHSALRYEKGLPSNPLTLSWVSPPAAAAATAAPPARHVPGVSTSPTVRTESGGKPFSFPPAAPADARSVQDDLDFEKMVLEKMRARAKEQRAEDALTEQRKPVD